MESNGLSKVVTLFYRQEDLEEQSYKMVVFLRGNATNRHHVQQMHALQEGMRHLIREEEKSREMIPATSIACKPSFFFP
jgi:hypothetical protein